ncbi:3-oxoacyl-reductase [Mytilinidion resinicola]|uniref:3-oxoacyl-reductase n=1 Tax=Mytilinidion resinicola TaxID=574789 RepID=A0A6A6YFS6_9PEZI|nr:3-oxoacyl-reductase [Mytilinidion resinicola]KAF2807449.1 3-oxoacyl-reductase [Mytilinidion resinicola]
MSYKSLAGKTFIVTGASSGMCRSTAILLGQQGANVGLFDLRSPDEVAAEIEKAGGSCLALACNVQSREAVDSATEAVVNKFGSLHGAANMAGIAATRKTPVGRFGLTTLEDDDWDMIMKTNLDGVKNCLRAQLQAIKGPGSIVNAASTAGQYGPPNCSPYVVSKWGVIGLTKTAAKEVGKQGIRVNAVAPGVVATALTATPSTTREAFLATTALGRIGEAEEIAKTILFLLSDEASFITASVVNVDGGYF